MLRHRNAYIIWLGLLIFLCGSGLSASKAVVAGDRHQQEQSGLKPVHLPHKDPERVQTSLYTGIQGFVTKKLSAQDLSFYLNRRPQSGSFFFGASGQAFLFKKDYLLHIYPSHNFW